jgi:hypothetical protein
MPKAKYFIDASVLLFCFPTTAGFLLVKEGTIWFDDSKNRNATMLIKTWRYKEEFL